MKKMGGKMGMNTCNSCREGRENVILSPRTLQEYRPVMGLRSDAAAFSYSDFVTKAHASSRLAIAKVSHRPRCFFFCWAQPYRLMGELCFGPS